MPKFQEWLRKVEWKSFLIYLYVLFLPLSDWSPIKINSYIIILISFIWLLGIILYGKQGNHLLSPALFLLSGLFFIQLVSFVHGGANAEVFSNIIIKLPLFIFPLVWSVFDRSVSFQMIQRFFIAGTVLACICSLRFLGDTSYSLIDVLDYTLYENYLVLHRPYFGIYLLLALSFLLDELRHHWWSVFLFIFLLFFLYLIQAKTSWLAFFFMLLIHFSFHRAKLIRIFLTVSLALLLVVLIFGAALYYHQHQNELNSASGLKRFFILSINTRMVHYDCAWDIIQHHLFTGAGSGNTTVLMNECYRNSHPGFDPAGKYFNAHNEFLEEGIRHGLIGVLTYLFCFFFFFQKALRDHHKNYIQFLVIIFIASLTESLFSRSQGVLLFAFLNTFFYFKDQISIKGKQ
jgi:O-antigen ligase